MRDDTNSNEYGLSLPKAVWRIIRGLNLGCLVLKYHKKSILVQNGWFTSFRTWKAVDSNKEPIPWLTYSVIHFLESRLTLQMRLFEYGCGNSTLWFSKRVGQIIAVEDDQQWFERTKESLSGSHEVIFQRGKNAYINECLAHGLFDIIVIDGKYRRDCAIISMNAIKPSGVIIWDNSEREDATEGIDVLLTNGYKELQFFGMLPITFVPSQTSIFYRKGNNCLAI